MSTLSTTDPEPKYMMTPACEKNDHEHCAGKGDGGYWKFGGELAVMNPMLKIAFPGGVQCPCDCHKVEGKKQRIVMSPHCEKKVCKDCPGTGNAGIWVLDKPGYQIAMEILSPEGVRCPCECHEEKQA